MANIITLSCHVRSEVLGFATELSLLIPDGMTDVPVLYLLHGMHGDCHSWTNGSSIARYARARGIAVVMPSVKNSFYTNQKYGERYYDYVSWELPAFLARNFPTLSTKRERTFVAGLSMGGYGAFKLALRNPDRYAAAASLSGSLGLAERRGTPPPHWNEIATANWGEQYYETLEGSVDDLHALLDRFPTDAEKPRLYLTCGTEDALYPENVRFRELLSGTDFDYRYEEGPGVHNWDFWDAWICPAIDFMTAPLTQKG